MKLREKILKYSLYGLSVFLIILACGDDEPTGSGNYPPDIPYAPSPNDGSSGRSVDSDLFWRCGDPDGHQLTYKLYFDTSETPQLIVENHPDTMYGLGTLDGNTTYYWRVIAFDTPGDSAAGPLWIFTTGDEANFPPEQPSNPNPENNAIEQPINSILSWQCSDRNEGDFLSYNLHFDTLPAPSLRALQLSSASYNPGTLEPNTQYFWKVVAYDNQGDSTSGPIWNFTTGEPAEGVFAAMTITRLMIPAGGDSILRTDEIVARFDSAYAPYNPVIPLEAEGVTCNEYLLIYDNDTNRHRYIDPDSLPFIELDSYYIFDVSGAAAVPAMVDSIRFPDVETYITSPENGDTVGISGFTITWNGNGVGTVMFMILSGEDTTGVSVETDNDGEYTFSTSDLEPLGGQAGDYSIMIIHQNEVLITAAGYDSRSYIWARVINTIQVHIR